MNFSPKNKFSRLLSLVLVLVMMATLFAGCKKDGPTEDTTEPKLNLNLDESSVPTETEPEPTETTGPVVNENTATVTSQMNIRSSPSTEATVVGNLYAGDKVEISRRETVTGINWAYIIAPEAGWIMMDYVEMDIPQANIPNQDITTPAGQTTPTETKPVSTTSIKAVVNANGLNIRSEASTNGKVQGAYNKGDIVTILDTKNGWGRTNKGWIKMEYVSTATTSTESTTNKENSNTGNSSNITGNGSTTVQFKGIVTASELNVRSSASQSADKVGSLSYGARVEILEKSGDWGRTKDGWISLTYIYQDGATGSKTGGGVVSGDELNIRSGPGTGYASVGSYHAGDRVTILEQFTFDGVTWGCTNKGWISLQYVKMDGVSTGNDKNGIITGDGLNIRSGPGTNYASVGTLNTGDRVVIVNTTTVGDTTWGNIAQGWISMKFVDVLE